MTTTSNHDAVVVLCPYCGHAQSGGYKCQECQGLFEPLSRRATQISMGPWYIRDKRRPFRPGCSYDVLQKQIKAGRVKGTTVLRGPTTRQFWSVARNVPGVAHLLGYCHQCNGKVDPQDTSCPHCGEVFPTPRDRNELGLMYPTSGEATRAQKQLDRELAKVAAGDKAGDNGDDSAMGVMSDDAAMPGGDLLDEVLGRPAAAMPATERKKKGTDRIGAPRMRSSEHRPSAAEAPARHSRRPEPAEAVVGLDFAPSDDADAMATGEVDLIGGLTVRNRRLGVVTWLLVSFNVVMLVAVLIWIMNAKSNLNTPKDGSTDTPSPNATAGAPQPGETTPQPAPTPGVSPAPGVNPAPGVTPTPAPGVNPTAQVQTTPPQNLPPGAFIVPPGVDRVWADQINTAEDLRKAGKLRAALAILISVRANAPEAAKPTDLSKWIAQLEQNIRDREGGSFFGISTD